MFIEMTNNSLWISFEKHMNTLFKIKSNYIDFQYSKRNFEQSF